MSDETCGVPEKCICGRCHLDLSPPSEPALDERAQRALKQQQELAERLLAEKELLLTVRVDSVEEANEILEWMYSKKSR